MRKRAPNIRRHKRTREKREGMVLLITAFVLLIVSGTAMFAIQQGIWEMRAAGTSLQAMRTRYVSETFVMAGLACLEMFEECMSTKQAGDTWRAKYGVPAPVAATGEFRYELRPGDLGPTAGFGDLIQTDDVMSGGGLAAVYEPNYRVTVEEWWLEEPTPERPESMIAKRYVLSSYGELTIPGDATTSALRGAHETISITRAYYGN